VERYILEIDENVRSGEQLFARYTDTIFLGESGISNWDWFEDLFYKRFKHSDICVLVTHRDLSGLSERDRSIYLECVSDIQRSFPGKLIVSDVSSAS
jgi:hypothetical protein